ncbi:MAG: hypothetical protein IJW15_01925 [Clostridia bacterium]|nr:hypothetical protein [Clostridia bacterium]
MTRDDLRGIIEGITDEQLKKILDINSQDIGKAKNDGQETKEALDVANQRVAELEGLMEKLKNSQCEAEEMKIKIDELQKVIDERNLQSEKQQREKALKERFAAVVGEAKFLNEFTEKGVFEEFLKSLENPENQERTDNEIFTALTSGKENLFDQRAEVPRIVSSTTGFGGELEDGEIREIMGLPAE